MRTDWSIYFPWSQPHDLEQTVDKVEPRRFGERQMKSKENKLKRIQSAYKSYAIRFGLQVVRISRKSAIGSSPNGDRGTRKMPVCVSEILNCFLDATFDSGASEGAPPEKFKDAFFESATLEQKTSPELTKTSPEIGLACDCPSIKLTAETPGMEKTFPFFADTGSGVGPRHRLRRGRLSRMMMTMKMKSSAPCCRKGLMVICRIISLLVLICALSLIAGAQPNNEEILSINR